MKTTIDIPDALYRRVKMKSAQSGTPVRAIAISLFSNWLDAPPATVPKKKAEKYPAWFGILRPYGENVKAHDMESIRASIAKGRREEFLKMKTDESTSVADEMEKLRGGRCRALRT